MSDSTGLIVISFLLLGAFVAGVYIQGKANVLSAEIMTGVVRGTPASPGVREARLFAMWLPHELIVFTLCVFVVAVQWEIADQVTGSGVRLLAHFAAFITGTASLIILLITPVALFQMRAKLRRDRERRAKAD